ncbi:hypothetical protein HPC49_43790 [Pyxidicoccus fallax]|uniref:Uncharacterized protein n=2 Tax=Pyxidicoccus fallax TaxID=394095 RepID=A0A848LQW4_9BACT|nr:hypothetical protein [Pyxidicoccus fallax]NMO20298.1 hypothetical protein [Pyxidicoccus fallax]NPC85109.1 hypothetical protein [Pyxidicoccus fallax]
MQATRVGRVARPERKPSSAPASEEKAPVGPPPPLALPLERYVLVAWVLGRERAADLLSGLGASEEARAKELLACIAALPSARRQAKVAVEFGERADAAARLKALMGEAPEPLRGEIFRRLPPYHRTLFPGREVEPADADAPPALGALAERLIREATR